MTLLDHALAALLIVVLPPYSVMAYRRLVRRVAVGGAAARQRSYLATIVQHWLVTSLTIIGFLWFGRPLADLGLVAPQGWGVAIGIGLTTLLSGLLAVQLAHVDDPSVADVVRAKLSHLAPLLPQNDVDEQLFMGVAATAGMCEEVLYRGFLTWYLAQFLPLPAAVPIAALMFGLGHCYQGPRGVAATTAVGLVLAGLVLVSGSLWIAMAVHALVDLNSGLMARRALAKATSA